MSQFELRSVTMRAGRATLVDDVTLTIEPGSWCTVIGPNGAGKTSLVTAAAGLRQPATGVVLLDGQNVHELSDRERAKLVAFVPQHPVVPNGMSVADYVLLGRVAFHGALRAPSAHDRSVVADTIERLALGPLRHRDIATLSGGERQRTVLARTLSQTTRVVVLDEPITGLDVRHQMELLELLKKEVDECQLTVLATLHDLTLAGLFTDHLVLLDQGRAVAAGRARDVLRSDQLSLSYGTELRVIDVGGSDVVIPVRREGATLSVTAQ